MNSPLISVIVSCYNQDQYLPETLDSVLAQTHLNWECIIVNDGSPDNTEEITKHYCEKDKRFKYILKKNGGLSSARNAGLAVAKGDYIQFLDSDDLLHPKKLELQLRHIIEQEADAVVSGFDLFSNDLSTRYDSRMSAVIPDCSIESFLYGWDINFVIAIHTLLISKVFIVKNDIRFHEDVRAKEDWIFWIEIALKNAVFFVHTEKMAHYRRHNTNMTSDSNHMILNDFKAMFIVYDLLPNEHKKTFKELIPLSWIAKTKEVLNICSLEQQILDLKHSLPYRVGTLILKPYRFLKRNITGKEYEQKVNK